MSLVPKIEEVSEFAVLNDVDLACITDTWLKDRIVNNVVEIPGCSIIRRDREEVEHGGDILNTSWSMNSNVAKNKKFYGSIWGQSDSPEGTPA